MAGREVFIAAGCAVAATLSACAIPDAPAEQPALARVPRNPGPAFHTIDVPEGLGLVPGATVIGFVEIGDDELRFARGLPMVEVSRRPLPDGRTRYAFSLGAAQMATLRDRPEMAGWTHPGLSVGFKLCLSGPVPPAGPLPVTSELRVGPLRMPSETDVREGFGGGYLGTLKPCGAD